jgi:catechol 2,3-dioxygenase-like lactoylglutathione lyase family enzyme
VLGSAAVIAFASSTDLERARRFYEGVLGLRLLEQDAFACVFDVGGTMLRITAVDRVATPGYTVLGWRVDDIAALAEGLSARGVQFQRHEGLPQDERGIWTTPGGDKVAWFTDPDGNVLSLTQLA